MESNWPIWSAHIIGYSKILHETLSDKNIYIYISTCATEKSYKAKHFIGAVSELEKNTYSNLRQLSNTFLEIHEQRITPKLSRNSYSS